jgi:hypothetical protein
MNNRAIVMLISNTIIFMVLAILWLATPAAWATVVYTNDFEGPVGPEWSNATTSTTPTGGRKFLGQFGNESVTLSLSDLPTHNQITISLDIFVINSWYGNDPSNGPDLWTFTIPGVGAWSTTFSNTTSRQAYPDGYPEGDNPASTSALETNSLGYGGGASVYHVNFRVDHSGSSFSLSFSGAGLASASWGLDNVSLETGVGIDWEHPWPAETPFPKFIQAHYTDLKYVESISKFRSGVGHNYSDEFEAPNRSMKHYFAPLPQYREGNGTDHDIKIYAPVNGTISDIFQESHQLSNGEYRGYQLHIIPDAYSAFLVRVFHVNYLSGLTTGTHVNAGQWLGYADMREAYSSDLSVECIYAAPPVYPVGSPYLDRGFKNLSAFEVMTDPLFRHYQARGIANRNDVIISKDYRDANPVLETDWLVYHAFDWVKLKKIALNGALFLLQN